MEQSINPTESIHRRDSILPNPAQTKAHIVSQHAWVYVRITPNSLLFGLFLLLALEWWHFSEFRSHFLENRKLVWQAEVYCRSFNSGWVEGDICVGNIGEEGRVAQVEEVYELILDGFGALKKDEEGV